MTVGASIEARIRFSDTKASPFVGVSAQYSYMIEVMNILTNGSLAGQVDTVYPIEVTMTTGQVVTLDLNGTTKDIYNRNVVLSRLASVLVVNKNSAGVVNTTTIQVGGGANEMTGLFQSATQKSGPIPPGGFWWMDGSAALAGLGIVVAGTGDTLTLTNAAGATNTCTVLVMGVS